MSDFHNLKVSEIQRETPGSVVISFEIPEGIKDLFKFKAGQYITIKHPYKGSEIRRAYSICTAANEGKLRVGVKKVDDGTFSVFANEDLKEQDFLQVMPPEGKFILDPSPSSSNNYLAIAAGSGITPVLSIISTALATEPESNFVLLYGNRTKEETMFYDKLAKLQETYGKRLQISYVFSRKEEEGAMFGRIDRSRLNFILKNKHPELQFDQYFICGPEEMINEVSASLKETGVGENKILIELFSTSEEGELEERHDGDTEVTVILDDETESFTMSQKKSVLEAALDADLDAPYSCQGGICSTCIARLVEGKVEMRKNQILTDSEVAEGLILTCQSHPTTAKVVVDYDDV